MKKHLTFKDSKSDKFWSIEVNGKSFTVVYGKTGTSGTSQTKSFESDDVCMKEAEKLVKEKMKKGYLEKEVKSVAVLTSEEEEEALDRLLSEPEFHEAVNFGESMLNKVSNKLPFIEATLRACESILEGISDDEHDEGLLSQLGLSKKECKRIYTNKVNLLLAQIKELSPIQSSEELAREIEEQFKDACRENDPDTIKPALRKLIEIKDRKKKIDYCIGYYFYDSLYHLSRVDPRQFNEVISAYAEVMPVVGITKKGFGLGSGDLNVHFSILILKANPSAGSSDQLMQKFIPKKIKISCSADLELVSDLAIREAALGNKKAMLTYLKMWIDSRNISIQNELKKNIMAGKHPEFGKYKDDPDLIALINS